jgi:phosphoglycolate phosphatase-like HAD superfamily hydrolase
VTGDGTVCVLFDIDGTLCDTNEVDGLCYRHAAASALGVRPEEVDWSDAPHRSDSGIARWLWERFRSRPPTREEQASLRAEFVERLHDELRRRPSRFCSVPGAAELLHDLRGVKFAIGIGTGGWRASAELKLAAAGLDTTLLHATADDAEARAEIFSLAYRRVVGTRPFLKVLLVGDAVSDVETARHMGWGFLGVGSGADADRLRDAGARTIVADYVPLDAKMVELLCERGVDVTC